MKKQIENISAIEIERKFLLANNFNVNLLDESSIKHEKIDIVQAYTSVEIESEERIRKFGKNFFKATKKGTGKERHETEWGITEEEFKETLKKINRKPIIKSRYKLNDPRLVELVVDIYENELEPLKVLEMEFYSEEDSFKHECPIWLKNFVAKEITEDERFKNKNLFMYGKPKL